MFTRRFFGAEELNSVRGSSFVGCDAALCHTVRNQFDTYDTLCNSSRLEQMAIMLELDHPHIIKLLDFFEKRDNYYMVVEKVDGENITALHNSCAAMLGCNVPINKAVLRLRSR